MKLFVIVLLFFQFQFFNATAHEVEPDDLSNTETIWLWRGFKHQWHYNHRINRLGNYLVADPSNPSIVHTGATGLGKDRGKFEAFYSKINAKGLNSQHGNVTLDFYGREKTSVSLKEEVKVYLKSSMADKAEYKVIINGFDLISIKKADKLKRIRFEIGSASYDAESEQLQFDVYGELMMDCQSIECELLNQRFDYKLEIHYLILGSDGVQVQYSKTSSKNAYYWTKDSGKSPESQFVDLPDDNEGSAAAMGFTALEIQLDKAHWLVEWCSVLSPVAKRNNQLEGTLEMYFRQWKKFMKQNSPNKLHSFFASRENGAAFVKADILYMQFERGKVEAGSVSDELQWSGMNKNARSKKAERVLKLDTKPESSI